VGLPRQKGAILAAPPQWSGELAAHQQFQAWTPLPTRPLSSATANLGASGTRNLSGIASSPTEFFRKQADEAITRLDLPLAGQCLRRVLAINPRDRLALDQIAFVRFLQGNPPDPHEMAFPEPPRPDAPRGAATTATGTPLPLLLSAADDDIGHLNLAAARRKLDVILQRHPDHQRARQLLLLVDFLEGREVRSLDGPAGPRRLLAGVDAPEVDAYSGYFQRESDSGIVERSAVLETTFDQLPWRGVTGGLLYEGRGYEVGDSETRTQVIGTRWSWAPGPAHLVSMSLAPEVFEDNRTVHQYGLGLSSRIKDWRLRLETENSSFRDNQYTIRQRMQQQDVDVSVTRKLARQVEMQHRLSWGGISDGNRRHTFDGRLRFTFLPEWALDLKYLQASHARQVDETGDSLAYWSPRQYRAVILALGCKRRLAKRWRCEIETSLSGSGTTETSGDTENYNAGAGLLVHTGYAFAGGDLGITYADKVYLSAREKRLHLGGTFRFF